MTECFNATQTSFGQAEPTQGADKYWTVEMPECQDCLCTDCAYTNQYTTTLDVFSPSGISKFPYQVKEIYRGMSAMPADATPTAFPYGFTTGVETCSACGDESVTATMTYPRGGSPFQEGVPTATLAAQTAFERPSTLRTQVSDTAATDSPSNENNTKPLENTVLEHKAIHYSGQGPDTAGFVKFSLASKSGLSADGSEPNKRGKPSRDINSYAKMRFDAAEAAPSKDADGAAASKHPPPVVAMAMLLPIALLL
ncbi:hypothetical protein FBEOM_9323 [Fusarium beomiforme]|uniref:Uncharacterized protein n=1 Tax=Fusarium beomiforme TaxID=44412 RepID=A0A9P5ADP7_9HYPO|nr:hypothetical protein FBEOM_9323 [Fusarium beomiforme]